MDARSVGANEGAAADVVALIDWHSHRSLASTAVN
jgi:hypothetical protein